MNIKQKTEISYTEWLRSFKDACFNAGINIDKIHDVEHTPFVNAWAKRKNPENQAKIFINKIRENEKKKA